MIHLLIDDPTEDEESTVEPRSDYWQTHWHPRRQHECAPTCQPTEAGPVLLGRRGETITAGAR